MKKSYYHTKIKKIRLREFKQFSQGHLAIEKLKYVQTNIILTSKLTDLFPFNQPASTYKVRRKRQPDEPWLQSKLSSQLILCWILKKPKANL